ncbi:hypothetical protein ELH75_36025 [Rhizobium leguminosarum]|nr:hypothetical protein ELH75_36025 [Rhizobium leguminosarum]
METDLLDLHCIQRRVGSNGLVIFERDDILLRRKTQFEDQTLGDIDAEFLAMLQNLRALDVRFGFIAHHATVPFDPHALMDRLTLTRLLDDLLKVSGALPDFWIDAIFSSSLSQRPRWPRASELDVISKLTESYKADPTTTVMVRKGELSRFTSNTPGGTEIFYPGLDVAGSSGTNRRAALAWLKANIKQTLKLE